MSTYPDWRAGMKLTPDRLLARQWQQIRKAAGEDVTSSTTFQDDDELAFPVVANGLYVALFVLAVNGATGGDFKMHYAAPAGASVTRFTFGPTLGVADRENTNMVVASSASASTDREYGTVAASGAAVAVVDHLRVLVGGTAGEVRLQWAQNTSSATATGLLADSFVSWVRLS